MPAEESTSPLLLWNVAPLQVINVPVEAFGDAPSGTRSDTTPSCKEVFHACKGRCCLTLAVWLSVHALAAVFSMGMTFKMLCTS